MTFLTNTQLLADRYFSNSIFSVNNTLWSCGYNRFGQLGLSNSTRRSSPVQIGALSTWTQVAAGGQNNEASVLAIQSPGTLWAWGYNFYGQLGLGNRTNRYSPVQVGALNYWTQISIGGRFTLSILSPGTLWAWGNNSIGQLGLNTTVGVSSPVQVGALNYWSQVSCGYWNIAAIQSNGTLWVWGNNNYGQLGLNTSTAVYSSPVQVGTLSTWAQVACGYSCTLAIQSNGTLWACGYNYSGNLGLNTSGDYLAGYSSLVQVGALSTWTQVKTSNSGNGFTAAIQSNGTLWSWGSNVVGQLGLNTSTDYSSPVQVGTLSTWTQVSTGQNQTAAIQNNGTLWTCGDNPYGQLAQNNTQTYSSLVQVGTLNKWNFVVMGASILVAQQIP
jgi:alpha-tubulin suppressor-like RCC1 family protein